MTAAPLDVVARVRSHGRSAFSFQALNTDMRHWVSDDACVAYADLGDAWVAVSNPLAAEGHDLAAMEQFARVGRDQGKRVRFFGVEGNSVCGSNLRWVKIGEQPVWNPQTWPRGLRKKVRGQIRRAVANQVVTPRMVPPEALRDPTSRLRRGLDEVISAWLATRRMAPMSFLVRLDPYHLVDERRVFVAERDGEVVAALIAIPIYARDGWFVDNMLRKPSAPNGAVEVLFDFAMRTLANEGCTHVTFGMCPLMGVSWPLLLHLRRWTSVFYNFEGLQHFKGKLMPDAWQPVFLVHPRHDGSLGAVFDSVRAFLPGGMLRFAWRTLARRLRTALDLRHDHARGSKMTPGRYITQLPARGD